MEYIILFCWKSFSSSLLSCSRFSTKTEIMSCESHQPHFRHLAALLYYHNYPARFLQNHLNTSSHPSVIQFKMSFSVWDLFILLFYIFNGSLFFKTFDHFPKQSISVLNFQVLKNTPDLMIVLGKSHFMAKICYDVYTCQLLIIQMMRNSRKARLLLLFNF